MKIGYAIQAHPSRQPWASALARQFDADIAWSFIAEPGENPKLLAWDTWKRAAWLAAGASRGDVGARTGQSLRVAGLTPQPPAADWAVVLQDDAIPVSDLRERLSVLLPDMAYPIVQMFYRIRPVSKGMHRQAMRTEVGGFPWPRILSAVGLAINTQALPEIIDMADQAHGHHRDAPTMMWENLGDDPRLDYALLKLRQQAWHVIPPLVNHREGPSVAAPTRKTNRQAWRFKETVTA